MWEPLEVLGKQNLNKILNSFNKKMFQNIFNSKKNNASREIFSETSISKIGIVHENKN